MENKTYDVFISYSREDIETARKICAAFDKVGITYFIDMQGIGGGQEFPLELATAIRDCSLFLFLASKNSYHSKFTDAEITFAFKKKKRNQIIPYIIDNSKLPIQLEFVFSSINWCTQKSHPIEPDLVNDILSLLNHSAPELEQKVEKYPKKKNTLLLQKVKILNLIEKYKKGIILFTLSLLMAILIIYSFSNNENSTQFKTIYKAAITGDAKSQNQLGLIYEKGLDDIAIDKEEAVKWYQRAAEQGFPEALDNLGNCFYQGIGVSLNYKEAVKWYTKAAEQGYNISQNRLGNCYFHGKGVEKNYKTAFKWYTKAANQGNVNALDNLGYCYFHGKGVEKNYSEAVKWYRKAAEQGLSTAQYNLAQCYEFGLGIQEDYTEAIKWYRKAAEQGSKQAAEKAKMLENKLPKQ